MSTYIVKPDVQGGITDLEHGNVRLYHYYYIH